MLFRYFKSLSSRHHTRLGISQVQNWFTSALRGEFTKRLSRRKISDKISSGYALTLGILLTGTLSGFLVGDFYEKKAYRIHEQAQQELAALHQLQIDVLLLRGHQQQFLAFIHKPKLLQPEYADFLKQSDIVSREWTRLNAYIREQSYRQGKHTDGIPQFLQTYDGVPETYVQQVRLLTQKLAQSQPSLEESEVIHDRLLEFSFSSIVLKFDQIDDDLNQLIEGSAEDLEQTNDAVVAAEHLRVKIMAASLLLSIVTATFLAINTSRAIADPVLALTETAKKVIQQNDFSIQASIQTQD